MTSLPKLPRLSRSPWNLDPGRQALQLSLLCAVLSVLTFPQPHLEVLLVTSILSKTPLPWLTCGQGPGARG